MKRSTFLRGMKQSDLLAKLVCVPVVAASLVLVPSVFGQNGPDADRYIVELKPGNRPEVVAAGHGLALKQVYTRVLNGFAVQLPPGRLQALANDARVAAIVPDQRVFALGRPSKPPPPPPPPTYGDLKQDPTDGEVVPPGVARVGARKVRETGAGVGVAVVDTGLDLDHPELLIGVPNFVSPGFSYYTTSAEDDVGHGTHVGGIIAAMENGAGIVGVAPGATLFAVKVLDNTGSGYDSDIISGLDWVAVNAASTDPNIRVVNMSLGRPASPYDSPMHTAIQNLVAAGITVVASAGNDPAKEVSKMVPAGFSEVIAVASTTAQTGKSDISLVISADTASFFTTDGKYNTRTGVGVAISAPGETQEDIEGGYIYSAGIYSTYLKGGYASMSGTSMAAPHVTGVVALLLENPPLLTPAQVKAKVMSGDKEGVAPYDSPTTTYTFDREREGILFAPIVLGY